MNMKELASKIAKLEGKKHQASVGDVREIIGLVSDAIYKDPQGVLIMLCNNGRRRSVKRKAVNARKKK